MVTPMDDELGKISTAWPAELKVLIPNVDDGFVLAGLVILE